MFSIFSFISRKIDKILAPDYYGPSVAEIARDMNIIHNPNENKKENLRH